MLTDLQTSSSILNAFGARSLHVNPECIRRADYKINQILELMLQSQSHVNILSLACGPSIPLSPHHVGPSLERQIVQKYSGRVELLATDIIKDSEAVILGMDQERRLKPINLKNSDSIPFSEFDETSGRYLPVELPDTPEVKDCKEFYKIPALDPKLEKRCFSINVKRGISFHLLNLDVTREFDLIFARHVEPTCLSIHGCEIQVDLSAVKAATDKYLSKNGVVIFGIDHRGTHVWRKGGEISKYN